MIKLLKSGLWALEGMHVVEMVANTECDFGPAENCLLVEKGWAEWAVKKAYPVDLEVPPTTEYVGRRPGRPPKNPQ